ncbi:MAG: 50S ribosomal protein L32e [Candidatus Aenigmatarchaeota archaeon]
MVNPKKKPKFLRSGWKAYKRLRKAKWRKARGMHSKIRRREKGKPKMPNIGYGAPKRLKYLHPSGFREILVCNVKDLEKINPEKEAVKISSTVGKKKREEILKRAEELNIKILNP